MDDEVGERMRGCVGDRMHDGMTAKMYMCEKVGVRSQ